MQNLYYSLLPEGREDTNPHGVLAFLALIIFMVAIVTSVRFTQKYFDVAKLQKEGIHTTGNIVQRIQKPRNRSSTLYYIRYEFENRYASQKCVTDRRTRITPKNKACEITYQIQSITEAEYKELSAPQTVNVLYLPSDTKTHSVVTGLSYGKNMLGINIALSLIAMFASVLFLMRQFIRYIDNSP